MNRPVHFEIQADDCARAAKFYTDVFGWRFEKWEKAPMDYWMIYTGEEGTPGINGGLYKRPGAPVPYDQVYSTYKCTMDVADIDATMAKINASGGKAMPKVLMEGLGWFCNATDSEGNGFGLMQATS